MKKVTLLILALLSTLVLVACGNEGTVDPITYTVTFNSDGGTEVAAQSVEAGKKATLPDTPTKEGFTFEYWFESDAAVAFNFNTAINADITLTAKWTPSVLTDEQKLAQDIQALENNFILVNIK